MRGGPGTLKERRAVEAGERRSRRLAAILAADVVGYSRLVGADEPGASVRGRASAPWT